MVVSQGRVAARGYTVAQAKVSVHMVGVAAKVEAMVAEQGGVEAAEVQNVLGKEEEDMVVECFIIYRWRRARWRSASSFTWRLTGWMFGLWGGLASGSTVTGTGTGLGPWMQRSSFEESG